MINKNFSKLSFLFFLLILFSACNKNTKTENITSSPVNSEISKSDAVQSLSSDTKVDLDLTKMSATMIYSTVFDMLIMPDEYENKCIKVKGNFEVFTNEITNQKYFAVLIPDATACCQQGIEFVWLGNHSYPQDYPEIGQEITITGTYQVTEDKNGVTYTFLNVTEVV